MTKNAKMYFVAVVSPESNTVAILEFLSHLHELLASYIGEVNTENIQRNFSTVSFLLEEAVDHNEPGQVQVDVLKLVVPTPSVVSKVVEQVQTKSASLFNTAWTMYKNVSGQLDSTPAHLQNQQMSNEKIDIGFGSKGGVTGAGPDIWYRGGEVKHNTNEIFFDVVDEIVSGLYDSPSLSDGNRSLLSVEKITRVEATSKLSGIPECRLHVKDLPNLRENFLFHPCALPINANALRCPDVVLGLGSGISSKVSSIEAGDLDRAIVFTPPEGSATIATLVYPNTTTTQNQATNSTSSGLNLPFTVNCSAVCGADACEVKIQIRPTKALLANISGAKDSTGASGAKGSSCIESLAVSLPLPSFLVASPLRTSLGEADFDETPGRCRIIWRTPVWDLKTKSSITLEGTFKYVPGTRAASGKINNSEIEVAMELSCGMIPSFSICNGVKIEMVEVKNADYIPFKGCRYSSKISSLEYRVVFDGRGDNNVSID
eukprot:GDKJ01033092.1.p1 GENE.GDKJ01033092.1~~GDKJ01033092.1.p1  ORF type:complete len:546 (-),score=101.57 GDKJ01033092.1:86-1549(-)